MTENMFREELLAEFMPEVEDIVRELDNGVLPFEDLVQEGMLGLLEALDRMPEDRDEWSSEPIGTMLRREILEAARGAREAYAELGKKDLRLLAEVERLSGSIDRLTESLGDKPNIDEIANDLGIPQRKVLDILKLTGETPDDEAFFEEPRSRSSPHKP